jgi:hypothetical protein
MAEIIVAEALRRGTVERYGYRSLAKEEKRIELASLYFAKFWREQRTGVVSSYIFIVP